MISPFDRFFDLLSVHPARPLVSNFPIISFGRAVLKVKHGNYRTLSKRNVNNEMNVFLCLPDGTPLAIIDLEDTRGEVYR